MRTINLIVDHCSATKEGQHFTAADIDRWHRERGFRCIGYHYVVLLDGTIEKGRSDWQIGAHVKGHNKDSIGVCYIGGLDANGKPKDTRTPSQKEALLKLHKELKTKFPNAEIIGHRDLSPDLDGDGVVEKHEWLKACPCYDAKNEYNEI